jgi:dipeptidase D
MAKVLDNLEPKAVWQYFEEICQYPHCSKKEEPLANYITDWAKKHNFEIKEDDLGNICIKKPATKGMENRKPVVIQGHIDMVCEKNRDVDFDFDKDPIHPVVDGDWVKAKGTTLGADNGVGVAMGMAILASDDIAHPDMEILCTLDEETGLTGAMQLGTDLLDAEILINLDSEEDGSFTIGCAGGLNTSGSFKYEADSVPGDSEAYEIYVKGLKGGHSGLEIGNDRGNAIKFLNRLLWNLTNKYNIRIASFDSGSKHNAIPREGFAVVTVSKAAENDFKKYIEEFNKIVKNEYATNEPNLEVGFEKTDTPNRVMTLSLQKGMLNSFYVCPHGVIRMSPDIDGLVQTSNNLAIVETKENEIFVLTSQRSSVESEKTNAGNMVRASLESGGAEVKHGDGYPAWQPDMSSPILNKAIEVFKDTFDKEPVIEAIHAGLECGLIGEKYPGMDMLSFGPNLEEVHSPDERIQISTVQNCWKLLLGIIENIPEKK